MGECEKLSSQKDTHVMEKDDRSVLSKLINLNWWWLMTIHIRDAHWIQLIVQAAPCSCACSIRLHMGHGNARRLRSTIMDSLMHVAGMHEKQIIFCVCVCVEFYTVSPEGCETINFIRFIWKMEVLSYTHFSCSAHNRSHQNRNAAADYHRVCISNETCIKLCSLYRHIESEAFQKLNASLGSPRKCSAPVESIHWVFVSKMPHKQTACR